MRLLVKFPTKSRPDLFLDTLQCFLNFRSGHHEIQYVITCDNDDHLMNNDRMRRILSAVPNLSIHYGDHKTKVEAINADIPPHGWDVLLLASDDMKPVCPDYDDVIFHQMLRNFPDYDGALFFNDGHAGESVCTLSIMGINLYHQYGYIYHPSYQSLYCDNEYTITATNAGKMVYINKIIIEHQWVGNNEVRDELCTRNERYKEIDRVNFETRQKMGFPK